MCTLHHWQVAWGRLSWKSDLGSEVLLRLERKYPLVDPRGSFKWVGLSCMYEFRGKPCHDKRLKTTNWKLKNLMTGIAINHLLLWESSLVSLKPLEVGELHFRAQAAEGGRPVTFSRIPNQIPPSLTSFFAFNYQDAPPFSGSLTCHMKQSLFIKRGPRLLMAAPLAPTQKKPQRPLFLFWPTPREPVSTLEPPLYAAGCWT